MRPTELPELPDRTTETPESPSRLGYDLLRFRPVKALARWSGFPYVFQAALLALFVFLC
jgi:hypothetical protein